MDKQKIQQKIKEKRVWIPAISFLVAVGLLSASQAEWVKTILTAMFGW